MPDFSQHEDPRTEIDICNDVLVDKIRKIFAPLSAAHQAVLADYSQFIFIENAKSAHTSSASQLAMTRVLRGFHPFLKRTPSPRTNSCVDTVPDEGSVAPITQAVSI